MRLFVAITLPEAAATALDSFLEARRDVGSAPRWSDSEQWHITLAFMGQAPARAVDDLVDRLTTRARRWAPLSLQLAGGVAFPTPYAARVLAVGVDDGEDGHRLADLSRSVRHTCSAAGCAPDGASFRGHVTLGRFRPPVEATKWLRLLDGYQGPEFRADHLEVVESHLGTGGRPRHEGVASIPLGPGIANDLQ